MPADRVFAAAFGDQQPVTANVDEVSRAQNRRVEMSPVPRVVDTADKAVPTAQSEAPSLSTDAVVTNESAAR